MFPHEGVLGFTLLKNGEIYVVRLHEDGKRAQGDVQTWFHSANRYRAAALDPAGRRLFVATDNQGNLLGLDRLPTNQPANPGAILVFTYNRPVRQPIRGIFSANFPFRYVKIPCNTLGIVSSFFLAERKIRHENLLALGYRTGLISKKQKFR
ncbi:hypothetical protein FACS1894108_03850 [Planctomycetales bacterium]|nr:hypothetical protein FACS1894108_03850 [Planctomycetales bacterium]